MKPSGNFSQQKLLCETRSVLKVDQSTFCKGKRGQSKSFERFKYFKCFRYYLTSLAQIIFNNQCQVFFGGCWVFMRVCEVCVRMCFVYVAVFEGGFSTNVFNCVKSHLQVSLESYIHFFFLIHRYEHL